MVFDVDLARDLVRHVMRHHDSGDCCDLRISIVSNISFLLDPRARVAEHLRRLEEQHLIQTAHAHAPDAWQWLDIHLTEAGADFYAVAHNPERWEHAKVLLSERGIAVTLQSLTNVLGELILQE